VPSHRQSPGRPVDSTEFNFFSALGDIEKETVEKLQKMGFFIEYGDADQRQL